MTCIWDVQFVNFQQDMRQHIVSPGNNKLVNKPLSSFKQFVREMVHEEEKRLLVFFAFKEGPCLCLLIMKRV